MSTIGSIFNTGLNAMQASQHGITIASNNIANANNLSYTRQRLVTAPLVNPDTGAVMGVQVLGIQALRDQIVERRLIQEDASRAAADTLHQSLGTIEVFFTDSESAGLQHYLTGFFNSFQTLSTDPSSSSFREVVRASGEALSGAFRRIHDDLVRVRAHANADITEKVSEINTLADRIARISQQIKQVEGAGNASALQDQRTALVRELSAIAEVRELTNSDTYQLTIGGNRLLVLGSTSFPLTTELDADGQVQVFSGLDDITAEITNGKLGAQIALRDRYAAGYLDALDGLAYQVVQQVNAIHATGHDLDGDTGVDFFTPLGDVAGAAQQMALSADVAGDARRIAAGDAPDGTGNGTAIRIGNLIFEPVLAGGSLIDRYRSLVFQVGTDAADAEISLREHEALAAQLEMRRQTISGVSIDEETVQILQFQRAFQASARLITAVDEMLQAVLRIGA